MDRQQMTDHDLLIRIDERTEGMEDRVTDHADRLRELEQNNSKIMGIVIAVGAGVTTGIHILMWIWDQIRLK